MRGVDVERLSFASGVFTLEASEPGEKGSAARKTRVLLRLGADGRLAEVKP